MHDSLPIQADIAALDMMKSEQELFPERRDMLIELLQIDPSWRMHQVCVTVACSRSPSAKAACPPVLSQYPFIFTQTSKTHWYWKWWRQYV